MNPIIMVMQLEMNKFTLQEKALGIIFRIKVYSNQVYMEHVGKQLHFRNWKILKHNKVNYLFNKWEGKTNRNSKKSVFENNAPNMKLTEMWCDLSNW